MDNVTPSNFAYSTVSTILPSMTMLVIEFLKCSSGVKQITISFDFFELIFIRVCLMLRNLRSINAEELTSGPGVLTVEESALSKCRGVDKWTGCAYC